MPIPYYQLDDRTFEDLVSELLARIPGHTPEWTNPRVGDPGRTLIDLFAWLGDTLLYRVNLLPERQRLAFLRLLNIPLQPARAAEGLVALEPANEKILRQVLVPLHTPVKGTVGFETCGEITVLPLLGQVYVRRRPSARERQDLSEVIRGLQTVYNVKGGEPYVTTPLFADGLGVREGYEIARSTVDQCLWIALLAPKAEKTVIEGVRRSLTRDQEGARILNVGVAPQLKLPRFDSEIGRVPSARQLWLWEITSGRRERDQTPEYLNLGVVHDGTEGFTRQGIVRLELPDSDDIGVPEEKLTTAGLGNRPPRIDDPAQAARLIAWIRLRPQQRIASFALSWVGINAINIDQRTTLANILVGTANGLADQSLQLPGSSVEQDTLVVRVEEENGFNDWQRLDDLAIAGRDSSVFQLDAEAGTLTFGDGARGRIPSAGSRIVVQQLRHGGGAAGNIAAGNITGIALPELKASQPLATSGGSDPEQLAEAEKRIPAILKHGDRAVTEEDYRRLALDTPGVDLGRVELLPRFKPHQRRFDVPGVVTVMVLPQAPVRLPPNPRPDRIILERVHAFLDERRPLATELYVIGVEYVSLGVATSVTVLEGYPRDQVLRAVRDALRDYLWPLAPGGVDGSGWRLHQDVVNQELEVVAARVKGVRTVAGVNLFTRKGRGGRWELADASQGYPTPQPLRSEKQAGQRLKMKQWQLPELEAVVVTDGDLVPADLMGYDAASTAISGGNSATVAGVVPMPVVPEGC